MHNKSITVVLKAIIKQTNREVIARIAIGGRGASEKQ